MAPFEDEAVQLPKRVLVYIAAVAAVAAGAGVLAWVAYPHAGRPSDLYYVGVLSVMVCGAAKYPLHLHARLHLLLDTAPILVACVVLEPGLAIVAAVSGTLAGQVLFLRAPWFQVTYNVSSITVQAASAAFAYQVVAGTGLADSRPAFGGLGVAPAITAAAIALLVANVGLTEGIVSMHLRRRPFLGWWSAHREDTQHQCALLLVGALGALIAEEHPLALPLLALPALGIYRAMRLQTLRVISAEAGQVQAELERSILASIADATPDFIATTDSSGHLLYLNSAARRAVGLSPEESFHEIHLGEFLPDWDDSVQRALADGSWTGESTVLPAKDTPIPVSQVVLAHHADGAAEFVSTIARDISERKRLELELLDLVNKDPLTNLFNRRYFDRRLREQLAYEASFGALLFMDLDGFKRINDEHGHEAGDDILITVARQLRTVTRVGVVLARIGGDEFAMLLPGCGESEARGIGTRVVQAIAGARIAAAEHVLGVGVSIGITSFDNTMSPLEILGRADTAMYQAKLSGGGYRFAPPPKKGWPGPTPISHSPEARSA